MDNPETYHRPTHISLCTGYGGIDLGLARVVSNLRTVAYCEREAAAIELLLSRMENGQLDAAPIWTDLRSFPWEAFSERVDILSGGYPCQPFSAAGKRLGPSDERHLWPAIADGVRLLRPRICFFENVEGHITLGLSTVISDLEGMGYKVSFGIFSAAEVGAPHQRKRVFIMAYRYGEGLEGDIAGLLVPRGRQKPSRPTAGCSRSGGERGVANTNDGRSGEDWQSSEPRATGLEQSPCTQGRSDEGEAREKQVWPSRPGEPQYWWEPPRVVADARRDQCERRSPVGEVLSGDDGETGACEESGGRGQNEAGEWSLTESGGIGAEPAVGDAGSDESHRLPSGEGRKSVAETWQSGDSMDNADCGRQSSSIDTRSSGSADCRGEAHVESPCGGAEPAVGDTDCGGNGGSKHDTSEALVDAQSERVRQRFELCEEERGSGSALPRDIEQPSATTLADSNDTIRCNRNFECERQFRVYEESGCFTGFAGEEQREAQPGSPQAEPEVGGDVTRTASGLGYGELCISYDNRTDELRMLGNGVVPATAARAFVTLINQLL